MLLSTVLSLPTDSAGAHSRALCASIRRICAAHQREQRSRENLSYGYIELFFFLLYNKQQAEIVLNYSLD